MGTGYVTSTVHVANDGSGSGHVEVRFADAPHAAPAASEVVVAVHAASVNPSDIGQLYVGADHARGVVRETDTGMLYSAPIAPERLRHLQGRWGQQLACGNEGAGIVVDAGTDPQAKALVGKRVAFLGGTGSYGSHSVCDVRDCLVLPDAADFQQGASAMVNPLTALGLIATARAGGHVSLLQTAAASALGQMVARLCREDGIPLVNIVRSAASKQVLDALGIAHVLDSSTPSFAEDLVQVIAQTRATAAFDAVGGGPLAGQVLAAMEAAQALNAQAEQKYSRYGSTIHKQVYIYGRLNGNPIEVSRANGMTAWSVGGWILRNFLGGLSHEQHEALKARIQAGLLTTFASQYSRQLRLQDLCKPEIAMEFSGLQTGRKAVLQIV